MNREIITIEFDLKKGFSILYKDFLAKGFFSGFVLFQSLLKIYNQYNSDFKDISFSDYLNNCISSLPSIDVKIISDLEFTWIRYESNLKNRHQIFKWESGESWDFILEIEKEEKGYNLIFLVANGDYDIPYTSGWDVYDDFENITNSKFPFLHDLLDEEYCDFNSLANSCIADADGRFVFIIQQSIISYDEILLVEYLKNDINDSIVGDEICQDIYKRLKKLMSEEKEF